MLGFSRASKHLPPTHQLQEKSDVTAVLDQIAINDETYDWSERELSDLLELASKMDIDTEEHQGLALVRREIGRRIGQKKNEEYAAEQEQLRIRRSPAECIRDIGLGIRYAAVSLMNGFSNGLKPKKTLYRDAHRLPLYTQRLEERLCFSGTPVAAMVGEINPGASLETSEQQFQTITESTVLAAQETGSSLGLAEAKNHFFGDPISLNAGESIEAHAQFTVLENSIGDRMAIAGSRSADGRNQLQNAMIVEFGKNGSGYLYLNDTTGQEWKLSFPMDPVDTGSVIDMQMTYDGTVIGVTLSENGTVIGTTTATAPKSYASFSVGVSNIKWDRNDATDTMQNFSLVKCATRQVPVASAQPVQTSEQITTNSSSPATNNDSIPELQPEETETNPNTQRLNSLSEYGRNLRIIDTDIQEKRAQITALEAQIIALDEDMQEARALAGKANVVLTLWSEQQLLESQRLTQAINAEQQFQTITESTVLAAQETGSSLALSQATNHFFGDPISLNAGESIEVHAEFTVLANSIGDRIAIAGSRSADGRNQLQNAMMVEFGKNGSGYLYLNDTAGQEWKLSFPMDTVDTGSVIDMRITYNGTTISVTLSENEREIGTTSAIAPKSYPSFSIGASNIKWDRTDTTDTMQNFSITKHATRQVPLAIAQPETIRVSDEEHMNAIIDGINANNFLTESGDTMTEMQSRKLTLAAEIQALEHSNTGAAMMFVTSENTRNNDGAEYGLFHVTYSSPYAQTYFEVTIDNDPGAGYSGTVAHPSGATNEEFTLNMTGLSGSNGNGGVQIRMYKDNTKTELLDTFTASYDRRKREVSGETARDEDAFRDGIRIDENNNGDAAYLPITGLNGSVLMQSWNTNASQGNMDYHLNEGVASFTAQGTLSSLDFSNVEGTVTDVYADLDIPEGVTVHAMIFRGGVQIGAMELTRGMPLIFSDAGGFSAILFETADPTTLTLNELLLQTNPEALFSAEVLSRAENGTLAGLLATEDFGKIERILVGTRFEYVLGQHNIYNHRGGAAGAIGNQYFLLGYGGGTYDAYTLYKPDTTGAGASLGEVRYLNDQGFYTLPQEYYTRINGAIIMHPGAPKPIAVQIASGNGVTVYQAGTASDIDMLINAQTDFHPEVSVQHLVNGPTSYTGFSNGFNEIGQVKRPVISAGETFHAVSLIYNNSGVSGQITVEVFTGDDNALIAGDSYTGTIGAYQRAQFVANATSPANASGLPSVRFRVTLPDGTQYWSGGMRSAEAQAAPGEAEGARISWVRGMMEAIADQHGANSIQFQASLANMQRIYGAEIVTTAMGQTNIAGGGGMILADAGNVLTDSAVYVGSLTERIDIPATNAHAIGKQEFSLGKNNTKEIPLTITEEKMVSLWITGIENRDITLSISGGGLGTVTYPSNKGGNFNGESVSLRLTPGTYTVTVTDSTDYTNALVENTNPVKLQYKVDDYNSANIEGMISIEGSEKVMPVSIRVAEFDPNTGFRLPESKNALDPNKPVWVVVHGKDNSENSSQIAELTRNLQALGVQVVTVDWQGGAGDNLTPIGLEGSQWITSVGTWVANQLRSKLFGSANINVIGHSWGAYVAYEIGAHIPGGIQTLVALDPAGDTPLLGGGRYEGFNNPNFSFSSVSANSYAFHSSNFGNREFALSARNSFEILAPENYEQSITNTLEKNLLLTQHYFAALGIEGIDEARDAYNEHGFAISLFTEILRMQKENVSGAATMAFSLDALRSNSSELSIRENHYEGIFFVDPTLLPNLIGSESGQEIWKANNFSFLAKDSSGNDIIDTNQ